MPGKRTSMDVIQMVCHNHHIGKSVSDIANMFSLQRKTVYNILNRAKNDNRLELKSSIGRPCKISGRIERIILAKVQKNPQISTRGLAKELQEECNVTLSHESIRKALNSNKSCERKKHCFLNNMKHNCLSLGSRQCRTEKRRRLHTNISNPQLPPGYEIASSSTLVGNNPEANSNFYYTDSATFESNDSFERAASSAGQTNSFIDIKQEQDQDFIGNDSIKNTLENEGPADANDGVIYNNPAFTSTQNSLGHSTEFCSNEPTIFMQPPSTSRKTRNYINDPIHVSETENIKSLPDNRNTSTWSSDILDENTSSSKENSFQDWAQRKRELLEIELLEMRNYRYKLELWEKEQQLKLACSKYTKDISSH